MKITKTEIEGVVIIEPKVFGDHRGYFFESFSQREFDEQVQIVGKDGIKREVRFVQDNESKSCYGVLRGIRPFSNSSANIIVVGVVRHIILGKGRVIKIFPYFFYTFPIIRFYMSNN